MQQRQTFAYKARADRMGQFYALNYPASRRRPIMRAILTYKIFKMPPFSSKVTILLNLRGANHQHSKDRTFNAGLQAVLRR